MEKVSIARRRQRIRLLCAQGPLECRDPEDGEPQDQKEEGTGAASAFPGRETLALSRFLAALGQGPGGTRRMGFALELEIDPQDPSRLKVELIPRPVSTGRFVTVRQASRLLRVSPEAVRRALTAGQLRGIKIGRQWRVCLERPRWLMPGQPTEEE